METNRLRKIFGEIVGPENLFFRPEDLAPYATDATRIQGSAQWVIRPGSAEEVSKIMKVAWENSIPVTPRGAGTGLSGGAVPILGGIVLDLTRLNEIRIDRENLIVRAGPGVVTDTLHETVEAMGLFYPPDPASLKSCTIGGNVAESAGGLRGLKYGVTRDYVLGLETVLANGDQAKFGCCTVKGVSGLDAARLICGSEGVLAVITQVVLKLIPKPKAHKTLLGFFDDPARAAEAVSAIVAAGILPVTLEIMDRTTLEAVIDYTDVGFKLEPEIQAMLLIETDGHPSAVADEADLIENIVKTRALTVRLAADEQERERLWTARRAAFSALARKQPTVLLEDITVPRSQLVDTILELQSVARKYRISIGTFGHAGDGNLHPTILTDRRDREEWARVEKAGEEIFDLALRRGGTLTGEHGIGIAKAPFLRREFGSVSVEMMRRIKSAWDPKNILNPGKIFPDSQAPV